jgi:hypothetical protein
VRLTDWRGNEYGVGDTVIYPRQSGRSVEVKEAVVLDISKFYRDSDWNWQRMPEEGLTVGNPETEIRVKVQPFRSSRFNYSDEYRPATITNWQNITYLEAASGS